MMTRRLSSVAGAVWGFPRIRSTILGVPKMRTIVFWGPYWGPLFWETTVYGTKSLYANDTSIQMQDTKS